MFSPNKRKTPVFRLSLTVPQTRQSEHHERHKTIADAAACAESANPDVLASFLAQT